MNILFILPRDPGFASSFCFFLKQAGATVLTIGHLPHEKIDPEQALGWTEYSFVDDLNDYNQLVRAVGYYTHKYGKIDKLESPDKQLLETESRLRSDFNIYGIKENSANDLLQKSRLKFFFNKAGVRTARCLTCHNKTAARNFIREVGFPVKMKPENGSDSDQTYIIRSEREFEGFYRWWQTPFKCSIEAFIDGRIIAYDGFIDRFGVVQFAANIQFSTNRLHLYNDDETLSYLCLRDLDPEVVKSGNRILKALDIRERYFHLEFVLSDSDQQLYALSVHVHPPEWWITDAINLSFRINVFQEWANALISNGLEAKALCRGGYYTAFVSRSPRKQYVLPHEEVLNAYPSLLRHGFVNDRVPTDQGYYAYLFRSKSMDEIKQFIDFVQEERMDYCI